MNGDSHSKIQSRHLARDAYVYVRQSSLRQVLENTESTERQYALQQRAVALGWKADQIIVVDKDLGQSGASSVDREGFQRLVTDVGMCCIPLYFTAPIPSCSGLSVRVFSALVRRAEQAGVGRPVLPRRRDRPSRQRRAVGRQNACPSSSARSICRSPRSSSRSSMSAPNSATMSSW